MANFRLDLGRLFVLGPHVAGTFVTLTRASPSQLHLRGATFTTAFLWLWHSCNCSGNLPSARDRRRPRVAFDNATRW